MNKFFGIFMIAASMLACGKTSTPAETQDAGVCVDCQDVVEVSDVVATPEDVTASSATDVTPTESTVDAGSTQTTPDAQ